MEFSENIDIKMENSLPVVYMPVTWISTLLCWGDSHRNNTSQALQGESYHRKYDGVCKWD